MVVGAGLRGGGRFVQNAEKNSILRKGAESFEVLACNCRVSRKWKTNVLKLFVVVVFNVQLSPSFSMSYYLCLVRDSNPGYMHLYLLPLVHRDILVSY